MHELIHVTDENTDIIHFCSSFFSRLFLSCNTLIQLYLVDGQPQMQEKKLWKSTQNKTTNWWEKSIQFKWNIILEIEFYINFRKIGFAHYSFVINCIWASALIIETNNLHSNWICKVILFKGKAKCKSILHQWKRLMAFSNVKME